MDDYISNLAPKLLSESAKMYSNRIYSELTTIEIALRLLTPEQTLQLYEYKLNIQSKG